MGQGPAGWGLLSFDFLHLSDLAQVLFTWQNPRGQLLHPSSLPPLGRGTSESKNDQRDGPNSKFSASICVQYLPSAQKPHISAETLSIPSLQHPSCLKHSLQSVQTGKQTQCFEWERGSLWPRTQNALPTRLHKSWRGSWNGSLNGRTLLGTQHLASHPTWGGHSWQAPAVHQ